MNLQWWLIFYPTPPTPCGSTQTNLNHDPLTWTKPAIPSQGFYSLYSSYFGCVLTDFFCVILDSLLAVLYLVVFFCVVFVVCESVGINLTLTLLFNFNFVNYIWINFLVKLFMNPVFNLIPYLIYLTLCSDTSGGNLLKIIYLMKTKLISNISLISLIWVTTGVLLLQQFCK